MIPVYTEAFSIVCSPRHPFAQRRRVRWAELVDAGWALPVQGTPLRQLMDGIFVRNGVLRPRAVVECSGYEQTRHVVSHSALVGVLPRPLALHGKAHGELALLRAKLDGEFAPISLLYRKEVDQPPLVLGFAGIVRDLARSMRLAVVDAQTASMPSRRL
ncbi:LysR substrate-binding domain-containing protein [Myxococcus xanthus]|uniref:LysR substrate-binding domain-containing protein n=1 Tax=Myxococcus xanthus TaxID=34 RepID=UPI003F512D1C